MPFKVGLPSVDNTEGTGSHCGSRDDDSCYSPRGLKTIEWSDADVVRDALASPSGPGPRVAPSPFPPASDAEPGRRRRAAGDQSFAAGAMLLDKNHSVTTVALASQRAQAADGGSAALQPAPLATDYASPFSGQQYSLHTAVAAAAAAEGEAAAASEADPVSGSLLSSYLAARSSAGAAPTNTCARMASRLHRISINGVGSIISTGDGIVMGSGGGRSRARPSLAGAASMDTGGAEQAALGLSHALSTAAAADPAADAAPLVGNSPRLRQRRATDGYRPPAADDARPAAPGPGDRRRPRVSGAGSLAAMSLDAGIVAVSAAASAGWSPPPPLAARGSHLNPQLLLHQQPSSETKLPALPLAGAASYRASADGSGSFGGMRPRAPAHSLFTDTKEEMTAAAASAAAQLPAPVAAPPAVVSSPLPLLGVEGKGWALRSPSRKHAMQPSPRRSGSGAVGFFQSGAEVPAPPRTAAAPTSLASPSAAGAELWMAGLVSPPPAPPPAPPLRGGRSGKHLRTMGGAPVSPSASPHYTGFGVNGYRYSGSSHAFSAHGTTTAAAAAAPDGAVSGGGSAVAAAAATGSRSAAALLADARELRQLSRAVSSRVLGSALAAADAAERRAGLSTYSLPPASLGP
ncbi:hypothetical protein CHLRE_03g202700v5 [Chlamydomonas reinhardtii]|uniref:Uncharacterized protein n=1 Tax=Chlamydomonas reinhardtii TaxID=3055 RepID=A0A2K3DZ96_CHLRE|nr:uncharacterized protein CHLRE_03g202700v5 [Chlamydomonas reinhardtii]PNW85853.1 hypothetical protein CHLRE_03g202700v5 [Chlamydomonas reinhardtii]